MSTYIAGFQSFSSFLHHFVLAKLATSDVGRVNVEGNLTAGRWPAGGWVLA